jgi:uncharacterized protein YhfF
LFGKQGYVSESLTGIGGGIPDRRDGDVTSQTVVTPFHLERYRQIVTHPDLPRMEFAFPGPLRDELVSAVLVGLKASTSSLLREYELEGSPLPVTGRRSVVVDSMNRPVAVIETTSVKVVRLGDVDLSHAIDEGEGFKSVAEWRAGHERFWHGNEVRRELGDPSFTVNEDTPVVLERFRLVERLNDTPPDPAP